MNVLRLRVLETETAMASTSQERGERREEKGERQQKRMDDPKKSQRKTESGGKKESDEGNGKESEDEDTEGEESEGEELSEEMKSLRDDAEKCLNSLKALSYFLFAKQFLLRYSQTFSFLYFSNILMRKEYFVDRKSHICLLSPSLTISLDAKPLSFLLSPLSQVC